MIPGVSSVQVCTPLPKLSQQQIKKDHNRLIPLSLFSPAFYSPFACMHFSSSRLNIINLQLFLFILAHVNILLDWFYCQGVHASFVDHSLLPQQAFNVFIFPILWNFMFVTKVVCRCQVLTRKSFWISHYFIFLPLLAVWKVLWQLHEQLLSAPFSSLVFIQYVSQASNY